MAKETKGEWPSCRQQDRAEKKGNNIVAYFGKRPFQGGQNSTPNSPCKKKKVVDVSDGNQKKKVGLSDDKKNVIDVNYMDDDDNDDIYNHTDTEAWKCVYCCYPHNTTPGDIRSCGSVYLP